MRPMFDSGFDDMRGVDVLHDVDGVFLGSDILEAPDTGGEADVDSVWLECSGDLLDVGSVKCLGVRKSTCGFETLLFICPRCNEPHESVRFR